MAMKAIKIQEDNVDVLGSRYGIEKDDYPDELPIGMHLVTDFGNEETFDVVTQARYDERFVELEPIDNGFVEIEYADG